VVDDFSTDNTGAIARDLGVTVMRPPQNTGSKAGAQNFALGHVHTRFVMAIDADTTLAPDAIENLFEAFKDEKVVAACGFVLPRYVNTIWERGRYVEYLFAFSFFKPIQDYFTKPLISSGCFSLYKTDILQQEGGWSTRTMAEDMDLTWSFYEKGYRVRFMPNAVCYPIEPHDYNFMSKQLRRWSHGFVQNVTLHWSNIIHIPYLGLLIAVAMWDAVIASFAYLFLIPIFAIVFQEPLFLLGYIIDLPLVLVPVLIEGARRKQFGRALASFPAFFILRFVNSIFMLQAFWLEMIMRRPLKVYEKGH
jgi:biofilm PGA synthesis N-glycosyltransferase PgaC